MDKLWVVLKREYIERVRSKWFLIATFVGPLFFAAMMVLPIWLSLRTVRQSDVASVTIVDATGTALGDRIALVLNGGIGGDLSRTPVWRGEPGALAEAETTATRAVMAKQRLGYLVLEPRTLVSGQVRYAGRNASSPADMARLRDAVEQGMLALRLEREGVSAERVIALTKVQTELRTEEITERGRGGTGRVRFWLAVAVALLLYITILLYGQNVLRGVLDEKTTRVSEVIVSSVPPDTLLAGKVLGVGAVGLTQQLIWIVTAVAMFQVREPVLRALGLPSTPFTLPGVTPGSILLLLLFFALGFVLYAALFAAVGAMVASEQEAQQAQLPVMFLVIASSLFIQPVLLNPSSGLARVASWVPLSAPIIMPLRLSLTQVSVGEIVGTIAGLLLACAASVWLAARIYRVGLLMYGKRPTLRELARWVAQSG